MVFELSQYIRLLDEMKLDEALEYRKKHMPKKIYKYISLSSDDTCVKGKKICYKNSELNEKKFETLKNNKLWLSRFHNLNDPFEYKCMYLKYDELSAKGWPTNIIDCCLNEIKNIHLIGSFTTNLVDNMPMWAHYSNNHQGFCVEYDVLNAKDLFPISYEDDRIGIASILTNIFTLANKISKGQINQNDKEFKLYMTAITIFALIKHKSWKYENEYRVLYADLEENKNGACIPSKRVGLLTSKIFVGSQCSEENKKRLSEISEQIGVKAYEMYLDDKETEYKLSYRTI